MEQLLKAARAYRKNGISCTAAKNKIAAATDRITWGKFQKEPPTDIELNTLFKLSGVNGVAVICGKVSGYLEIVDVDTKYDLAGTLWENLRSEIHTALPELSDRLFVVQTKSGGLHIYYRCPDGIEGNQKLARRPTTDEERKKNPNEKVVVLVETRGEGGYVIAPPTEGYDRLEGKEIPVITAEERTALLTICRSFNEMTEEQVKPLAVKRQEEGFAVKPWDDYNTSQRGIDHMMETLEKHGWRQVTRKRHADKVYFLRPGSTTAETSGDFCLSKGVFSVFTTSSQFEPSPRAYKPSSVFAILEHNGNFSAAGKAIMEMGFGEKPKHYERKLEQKIFQKKTEGYEREDLIKIIKQDLKLDDIQGAEVMDNLDKKWGETICTFWEISESAGKKKIRLLKKKFCDFLHEVGGFGLYFYDKNSTIYRIVRIRDGFVEESSTEQMKKFIMDYINSLPPLFDQETTPDQLLELVINQHNALFNEGVMEFLQHVHPVFLRDTATTGFFAFRNGVVVVEDEGFRMTTYDKIGQVIWKNQVKDFNVRIDNEMNPQDCEFYRFLECISGGEGEKLSYCISLIGYLLHRYKDPARPWAVILAEETENDKDGGGTGKGIFVKALACLMNTVKLDGKTFKVDKNFSLQRVSLDTQLIAVEDCEKNLDFEKFNSLLTEGNTVEKKNKDELFIDYKDSGKFMFTTNYTVNIKGNHGKRRSKVFEFTPFFSPQNTPMDFFGHLLFEAWDEDEWNRFYNFMFFALSVYIQSGIKEVVSSEKIKRKQIKLQFGEEYLEWVDEWMKNMNGKWKLFKDMYGDFCNTYDFDKKEYSNKRFKKAMEVTAEVFGWTLDKGINRQANNSPEYRFIDMEALRAAGRSLQERA